jgi:hypothetical protein
LRARSISCTLNLSVFYAANIIYFIWKISVVFNSRTLSTNVDTTTNCVSTASIAHYSTSTTGHYSIATAAHYSIATVAGVSTSTSVYCPTAPAANHTTTSSSTHICKTDYFL